MTPIPIPPFSEYRRFFASPKIGGIEGFDCTIIMQISNIKQTEHFTTSLKTLKNMVLLDYLKIQDGQHARQILDLLKAAFLTSWIPGACERGDFSASNAPGLNR